MTSYYYFRKAVEWKRKMPTRGWWHMRNTPESLMNLLGAAYSGSGALRGGVLR